MTIGGRRLSYTLIETALAVARTGSPAGAAREQNLSITTIYRHIDALEGRLGVTLFDRHHGGWVLRDDAQALMAAGQRIERELHFLQQDIRDAAGVTPRRLKIALSEDFATHYVAPRLNAFRKSCVGVCPELVVSSTFADLVQGEADVAIRPHGDPGDTLIGQRVGVMTHALYASRRYIRRKGTLRSIDELACHDVCGYGEALGDYTAAQWLEAAVAGNGFAARFGCTGAMTRAVIEGVGIALLPRYVGDQISTLQRLASPQKGLPVDIWLVTAAVNRKRPLVKSFFAWFARTIRADRALFRGAD